jgi:signal transduction histidine kinase/CheY-like chemotaxis protein
MQGVEVKKHSSHTGYHSRLSRFNLIFVSSLFVVVGVIIGVIIYGIVNDMAVTYARFYATETVDKLNSYLNREIALVERVARSPSIVEWFSDEKNEEKRKAAYEEMMSYAGMYQSAHLYFGINSSLGEFSVNTDVTYDEFVAFDVLNSAFLYDDWYFNCINADTPYQLNLDVDKVSLTRRVWVNYKVLHDDIPVGVFATGLQFDEVFNELFGRYDRRNVVGLIIDADGIIMMDSSESGEVQQEDYAAFNKYELTRIYDVVTDSNFVDAINRRLLYAEGNFIVQSEPEIIRLNQDGYEIASIIPIPDTDWTAVTFFNPRSLFDIRSFVPLIIILGLAFLVYFLIINRMISRLNIQSLALKDALVAARTASKAKGNFLSNMSHEIRTPLNAIIGMTTIGKNSPKLERKDYAFERIDDASKHLLGVINDILDISKIEAKKFELSCIEFNFSSLLKQVFNVIRVRVDEKKQNLSLEIDSNIPERLIGDDQRLAQVIANLLSNAVKFTPEGKNISLEAVLENKNDDVCTLRISIKDTGIGISPEQQSRLFTSFEQADSDTSRKYGGTGLGLAISKHIVEKMGGEIWLESELGKGSTFSFTAPLTLVKETIVSEENDKTDTEIPIFEGRRILLAEDIDINREIVSSMLEPTKLIIDFAANGREAVQMFSGAPNDYDLILMDIQMPEMDGFSATEAIRALETPNATTVPIIAMTANVFKEDVEKCLAVGMNDHLGKPLDFSAVLKKLKKYLG